MHTDRLTRSHSIWADLDALVLEEVRALGGRPERASRSPFVSEDAFVAAAVDYLRDRDDPMRLIDQLCAELGLNAVDETDMPDEDFGEPTVAETDENEPVPAAPADTDPTDAPANPDPDP
jgi:hypothetical protein